MESRVESGRCQFAKIHAWLTNLAPDIQVAILFLPRVESGPDTVKEIDARRIARVLDWGVQRE